LGGKRGSFKISYYLTIHICYPFITFAVLSQPVGVVTRRPETETRIASPDPYFKKVKKSKIL